MALDFRLFPSLSRAKASESSPALGGDAQETRFAATPSIPAPKPLSRDDETTEDRSGTDGLHGVLRSTDYWFNSELAELEREANTRAEDHAREGLPHHDLEVTEEIDAERILRGKAIQIFEQWQERVRRKLHDAIADICTMLRRDISALRFSSEWLGNEFAELKAGQADLVRLQKEEQTQREAHRSSQRLVEDKTVEYESRFRRWKYYVLIGLLVIVDWVANVPVFRELLPQEPGSVRAWQNLVATTERYHAAGAFFVFGTAYGSHRTFRS